MGTNSYSPRLDKDAPLTTGQVARLMGCAPRTVMQWFDRGLLPGYRLPGSRDRRFRRADVMRFMVQYKIRQGREHVLAVGLSDADAGRLAELLDGHARVDRVGTDNAFAFGVAIKGDPAAVVVDTSMGADDARWVVNRVAGQAPIVVLAGPVRVDAFGAEYLGERLDPAVVAVRVLALLLVGRREVAATTG